MKRTPVYIIGLLTTAAALTVIISSSCTSRRSKEDSKDLIPEKQLVAVLTDLYLADGLMTLSDISQKHAIRDSVTAYIEIVENHGFTKPQMDKTMRYYFISKPAKLQKIYDQVLARLTEMESRENVETSNGPEAPKNLWPEKSSYSFPEHGLKDPVYFNYEIKDTGLYTLTTSIVVFPDDQSDNPRITLWFWKADTSELGAFSYWQEVPLPKDGIQQQYTISARVPDSSFTHIRGWLINHTAKTGHWEKHSKINTISLILEDGSVIYE
jgi:hypothetical protein